MAAAALVLARRRRRPRVFNDRMSSLDHLTDKEVVEQYRLDKAGITYLVDLLGDSMMRKCSRSKPVPLLTQISVQTDTLTWEHSLTWDHYPSVCGLAKADFFSECGDIHGVSKASVCVIFDRFLDAINANLDNISFPVTQAEIQRNKVLFYRKCRLPGLIGAIDGTLIPILGPSQQEEVFRCRKRFHALNVQAVVNYDTKCLHKSGGSLQFRLGKCAKIVVACARLHNMCVDRNIAEPDGQFINDIADDQIVPVFAGTANDYRRNIINMF